MSVKYHFNSLEDFLISTAFTVDGQLDDGWGASFPVKGREIEVTVLFSDINCKFLKENAGPESGGDIDSLPTIFSPGSQSKHSVIAMVSSISTLAMK